MPFYILAPVCRKSTYNPTFWGTCPTPPMCARRQAPVSLAAAPHRELPKVTITVGVAGCKPAVGAKRVENDVKAIQKWVPFTSKCTQKRWWLGLRPRPPNSEGERFRPLPVWHTELKMVLRRFKNGFHLHPNAPKRVGGWGSVSDPQ